MMSRVESGTFRLAVGPVVIADVIEGAYQAVLPDLLARDLEVTVDVAQDPDPIRGDAAQLDRVMINLLTNAIKFTPDGGRITISADRLDDAVVIRVVDTGMGIPPDEQERIFERFFRSVLGEAAGRPGHGPGPVDHQDDHREARRHHLRGVQPRRRHRLHRHRCRRRSLPPRRTPPENRHLGFSPGRGGRRKGETA